MPGKAEIAKAKREHSISGKCNKEWRPSAIVLCKCKSCMVKVECLNPSLSRVSARSNEIKMDETLYWNIRKHRISVFVIHVASQADEGQDLESTVVGVVWILRKM